MISTVQWVVSHDICTTWILLFTATDKLPLAGWADNINIFCPTLAYGQTEQSVFFFSTNSDKLGCTFFLLCSAFLCSQFIHFCRACSQHFKVSFKVVLYHNTVNADLDWAALRRSKLFSICPSAEIILFHSLSFNLTTCILGSDNSLEGRIIYQRDKDSFIVLIVSCSVLAFSSFHHLSEALLFLFKLLLSNFVSNPTWCLHFSAHFSVTCWLHNSLAS